QKPLVINGLQQDVDYTFYVRAVCDTVDTSNYSFGVDYKICSGYTNTCVDFTALNAPGVTCTYGTYTNYNSYTSYYPGPYAYTGVVDYGQDSYGTGSLPGSRHTVHTRVGEMDSCSGWQLSKIPPGECKSVRLGCIYGQYLCQAVSYDINVDTNISDIVLLKYACVFYNPSHPDAQQPRFVLEILDSAGNFVDATCGYADFNASNAATANSGWNQGVSYGIYWKDWTPVGLHLAAYHGQTIKVRLVSFACGQGASNHFGYAYYTLSCTKAKIKSSSCVFGEQTTLSAPLGFNYRWYSEYDTATTISTNRQVVVVLDTTTYYCDVSFIDAPDCKFRVSYNHIQQGDTIRDTLRQVICPGGLFVQNGDTMTAAGWYRQGLTTVQGCDSILAINIRIGDTLADTVYRTFCAGANLEVNGYTYPRAGIYSHIFRDSISGCYSKHVVVITVNDTIRDTVYRTICAGASFDTNGISYYNGGVYIQRFRDNQSLCYHNLVIFLSVSDTLRDTVHPVICAGASFDTNGVQYSRTGIFSQLLRDSVTHCYRRLVIDLTVSDTIRDTIHRTICAGASFDTNAHHYTRTGMYSLLLRDGVTHCFHRLVIDLVVDDTIRDTLHPVICAGGTFDTNGRRYTRTGVYKQLLRDNQGCYTALVIDMTVHDTFRNVLWENICAGNTYTHGGQTYHLQGTYLQQLQSVNGCDSLTVIHLTVADTIRDTVVGDVCAGQVFTHNDIDYSIDGWYRQNLRTPDGCDSILHIHLTVADTIRDTLYFSVCAGKTVEVNGNSYANHGWYRQDLRTPDGCDSILHIALMVEDTIRYTLFDTICFGDTYNYNDSSYTRAGLYRHLLKTPDGCDSIVRLNLFVHDSAMTHFYDTIYEGSSYEFYGQTCNVTGDYNHLMRRVVTGCDSTLVLHLFVCRTQYTALYDTICENATYTFFDTLLMGQGVFRHTLRNWQGCDSTVELSLAVLPHPDLALSDSGVYCANGVATLKASTNGNYITWTSMPEDSSLYGQEHEFVVYVSPQRFVEYTAIADIQPYNCETSQVITLNKPSYVKAAIAIFPHEITEDHMQTAFYDNSIGDVVWRRWIIHEDNPTAADLMRDNDSMVYYTPTHESDSLEVTLMVANRTGCRDTVVNVYPILKGDIWAPNAFTPGRRNAGKNYLFRIGYNNVLDYEIFIYNRAGLLVFHSTDPDESWDGTCNYKECVGGSYVYEIHYTTKKYPKRVLEKTGSVLLIR
ncbi:MAG: gliding motility-associated C-terminal domain-containing protein, partial [Bacteroidales bacterium]|nr:gliding motility-associated C-terminal domain-containing protein [Bacteroidales bacterium]